MNSRYASLAYKLGIFIFLASAAITLVTTGVQLIDEYRSGIRELDANFQQIQKTNLPSITNALWQIDLNQLNIEAQGILNIRDIERVRIYSKDQMVVELHRDGLADSDGADWQMRLSHNNWTGTPEEIGRVEIHASYEGIRMRTLHLFWSILVSQLARTFTISVFIFFITNYFVISRLRELAAYLHDYQISQKQNHIDFPNKKYILSDEINLLIEATNSLLFRLTKTYQQLETEVLERAHSDAEKKIAVTQLQEIARLNGSLESQKTELVFLNQELEAFSYSVAHDLRSPLRAMNGFSQILMEEFSDSMPAEAKDFLMRIRNASTKMGQLIDDILTLAKVARDQVSKGRFSLSQLVRDSMARSAESYAPIKFEYEVEDGLMVEADPRLLRVAIDNLVDNAFKYSSKTPNPKIRFYYYAQKKAYCIKDNGDGFNANHDSNLFKPFFRLHSTTEFPGTGIGLATAARVFSKHGHRIWAESKKGQGATFMFTL